MAYTIAKDGSTALNPTWTFGYGNGQAAPSKAFANLAIFKHA
jgi:hypothetical protein